MCRELAYLLVLCVPFYVTPGTTKAEQIWREAEIASSITAPLQVMNDTTASGGRYVTVAAGNNSSSNPPSTGIARYSMRVSEGGVYAMYLRVRSAVAGDDDDSCWVRIQGATLNITVAAGGWIRNNNIDFETTDAQEWFWSRLRHYEAWPGNDFIELTVTPGTYIVEIAYREDGLWIDGFLITNEDVDPATLPDVIPYVPENISRNPQPPNAESDVGRDVVLSWTPAELAKTHSLYIGTDFNDVNDATVTDPLGTVLVKGLDVADYDPPGGLEFDTTYYWRVDEVNGAPDFTVYKGTVWSFTTEPYGYPVTPISATSSTPYNSTMQAINTINGSGLDPVTDEHSTLTTHMWQSAKTPQPAWIQYEFDQVYKLNQMWVWNHNGAMELDNGYGAKEVAIDTCTDGTTWTALANVPEFAQATAEPNYVHNTTVEFGGVSAKYVKLTINSNWSDGAMPYRGLSEVRFFQIPVRARGPEPESGATDVTLDTPLTWRSGRDAVRHEVYFGTDPNALVLSKTVTERQVALTALGAEYDRTYYWKVNEVNDAATPPYWEGEVWSFSTQFCGVVDDFESYNDQCNRVYYAWKSGASNSENAACGVSAYNGNGTGSVVGKNDPPYAEGTNVHSGFQAMPFFYDNTAGYTTSEATRTFSPAQDWTLGGVKTLVLFFNGDLANGAGQVYVKINGTQVTYNGSASPLTTGLWNQWNVDLSSLSVKAVSTLTIGVSGTGKGVLYLDDIRLYRLAPAAAAPTDPGTGALVAYYPFEGDARDASGKGYDGTPMNDPTFGDSKAGLGKALSLDGVNDYDELPIGNLISTLTSVTLSAWINFDTTSTGSWVRVFDFGTGTTAYMFLSPRQGTAGAMRFAITTGSNTAESGLNAPRSLPAGWHHVAVVIDGMAKTLQLVLDGEVVASGATTVVPKDLGVTTQNWLGRSQWDTDGYYQGLIDDFRIYDRALTAGEVRYLGGDR